MSLNDKDVTLGGNKGIDLHPGVANPTSSSTHADPLAANFVRVTDPTSDDVGAGAGPDFSGDREAARNFSKTSGVVEGRPGIIESANIDPLNENSNKEDGWANATNAPSSTGATAGPTASSYASNATTAAASAASVAAGAAKLAYGHAAGDEATKQAGKEAVWGKANN
ncbi:uncharacterized protein B0H18DRAFT_1094758 [Fomitopsis serialis]|uniref:uncharacterized protein n=1 Tax=Fomitopsis serialis TaxID=139415 RepID=UPI00200890A1|nr:uncharacterized protein B0H18DRAFT_1094758 [Neoantrodia serialis]KAH9926138.1 hypothetical protein B0H18DRAFT_1094758 [Neoantrodia serialis]